jgi:hypothetical protein
MSFFNGDLIVHTSMQEGIAQLKKDLYVIDSINRDLVTDRLLKEQFGEKELERFRNFVARNEILVTNDHKPPETVTYPCISIGIGAGGEDSQNKISLGDNDYTTRVNPQDLLGAQVTPRLILGPVTPQTYDSVTGQMTFVSDVSLALVFEGQYVMDNVNQKSYRIQTVLDDQSLIIAPGSNPNLNGMTVLPSTSQVGDTHAHVYCRESYSITAVAKDPVESIYVFQLAMLVLLRFKIELFEKRGFAVQTFTYTPLQMGEDSSPNEIWYRTINLTGRVEYNWSSKISLPIDGVVGEIKVTDQNLDNIQSPPGVLAQVEAQGWDMLGDAPTPVTKKRQQS